MVDCDFNNCNRKKIYIYLYASWTPTKVFAGNILYQQQK